jgi:hypothetical protein
MIEFLSPLYLAAAAAAAVPLLIHLLRRRIGTRVEFPAVRYLARAEREHSRKLRLRNLLLMMLRVVAVLLVALAAARPVARVAGVGHAPTAFGIALDNSLSSAAIQAGHPVLDGLKARAREMVRGADAGDRLWLVTADGTARGGDKATLLEAIDRVEPLAGSGDPEGAAARAAGLLRQSPLPGRVLAVLSDGQATSWRDPVPIGDVRTVVYRVPGDPPLNHGVVEAAAEPVRWTPRGAIHARVSTRDSVAYRIALEGRTLARGTVSPGEEIIVRTAPTERGWLGGTVELEPDELRGDDVRHLAVWIGPAPGVTVNPALGPFARSAVEALLGAGRVTNGGEVRLAPADLVTSLPALIAAPADPVRLGAANRTLERLGLPWRFGAPRRGAAVAHGGRLDGVTVSLRYVLEARDDAPGDTLTTVGGEPWIVGGPGYVIVASPLIPQATDLPVRAAFVPWLGDVISQRLGEDAGVVENVVPGARVMHPRGAEWLELAAGQRVPLAEDTISAPDRPGVFYFVRGERRIGALVVNPDSAESTLDRLSPAAFASHFRGRHVEIVSDSTAVAAAPWSTSPRQPIILPLLLLAVCTLFVEAAVAGAGRRTNGASTG